ncbi:hypothetical protein GF312_03910, partial [Candidatus Poribacteria bacterium]|nr:hypothetical protein [Candidatus Poribacteria bacterium]
MTKLVQKSEIQKILIFSFSHIGDSVLSTAVIPPLKRFFPDANISLLTGPKAVSLFENDPRIDRLIIYDTQKEHKEIRGKLKLAKELHRQKFDLKIDLRDTFWSRFIGGKRWGMPTLRRHTKNYKKMHAVDRYLDILLSQHVKVVESSPALYISEYYKNYAENLLKENGIAKDDRIAGIHIGGGWSYKLWDIKKYAFIADNIMKNYKTKVLIFAGPEETFILDKVQPLMKYPAIIIKDVNLLQLAALIQRCCLYIGNDTGPMHIAAALGIPVIAIFGPTDSGRSGPYGNKHIIITGHSECSPCHP